MIKILMGGSPCTYWSIAQTKNRETEASGMGWELFKNYLIAIEKYQPDYFLYENNKSMSAAIREQITKEFGFEPVMIDSALVSAQSRKRLYWLGRREPSGTYSRVNVELPEDRGILLRDILETGVAFREKTYHLDANYHIRLLDMDEQPIPLNMTEAGKAQCLRATCYKDGIRNMIANEVDRRTCVAEPVRVCNIDGGSQGNRIYSPDAKSCAIKANSGGLGGRGQGLYAEPIRVGIFPNAEGEITHCQSKRIYSIEGKGRVLNAGPGGLGVQTGLYAEPVRIGTIESDAKNPGHDSQQYRVYSPDDKSVTLCGAGGYWSKDRTVCSADLPEPMPVREATKQGYAEIMPGECVDLSMLSSKTRRGRRMSEKSNCLTTSCEFYEYCGTLDKPVYQVKDGFITIKDKQYPIKLRDGCYIIRKLTVTECKRLQTVPEEYFFPVSDTQAYKMLGNGWTIEVIAYLLSHIPGISAEPLEVLSMYDGMSCGHIALDKLGGHIERYYATEIDKYAIQTTIHNYPETVELGDAFQVRDDTWKLE